jgi:DNA-binding response OmpR family regulator
MVGERVLIIDHYDATLDLLVEVLKAEGYTPLSYFGSCVSAAYIGDARADLLILDLGVGDQDGVLELLRDLRQRPNTQSLPVIVNSTDERLLGYLAEDLRRFGCTALSKPFDLETLISMVRSSLGSRRDRRRSNSSERVC